MEWFLFITVVKYKTRHGVKTSVMACPCPEVDLKGVCRLQTCPFLRLLFLSNSPRLWRTPAACTKTPLPALCKTPPVCVERLSLVPNASPLSLTPPVSDASHLCPTPPVCVERLPLVRNAPPPPSPLCRRFSGAFASRVEVCGCARPSTVWRSCEMLEVTSGHESYQETGEGRTCGGTVIGPRISWVVEWLIEGVA